MLTHLHIRDLVIVRSIELDLQSGMTMLSGETGAGKSILIDALGLALGDRADASQIREDAERAEITANFDITDLPQVVTWLQERELDADGECILRRVVSRRGRSRAFINGRPAPVQDLHELAGQLLSIHGQHAHHELLHAHKQRDLLDRFGGLGGKADDTARHYQAWRDAMQELQGLERAAAEQQTRQELLAYQVEELDSLDLQLGELGELEQDQRRLANAEALRDACQEVVMRLYEAESDNVQRVLHQCLAALEPYRSLDPTLDNSTELLNEALIRVEEAATELREHGASLESDPQTLADIDQRLGAIQTLARKHHVPAAELVQLHQAMQQEWRDAEGSSQRLDRLRERQETLHARFQKSAEVLSRARQQATRRLGKAVTRRIRELGMPEGRFHVQLDRQDTPGPHGLDQVQFLIEANPGQPPRPLNKVASGGELSRVSLAIQVETLEGGGIPCLIFDEVDTGIGGGVAEVVGRLLRTLGDARQVFCVSHLPQVAAQAHHHLKVEKTHQDGKTETRIELLAPEQRVNELARMLGGIEITAPTLAHAREMLKRTPE